MKVLAKTGCVRDACRKVGISSTSAYRARARLPALKRQWEAALSMASSHIETLAWERAVTGIEETVIHYGKVVGTRIRRSDSVFRMLLQASNRKKYGRMGAVDRKTIELELRARIEAELRHKVERDVRKRILPRVASNAEVREALTKALEAYRERARKKREEEEDAERGAGTPCEPT